MHRIFGLKATKGLTEYVIGEASLEDIMVGTPVQNLELITAGPVPPDATLVLQSPMMRRLFEGLADRVDLLIFDSPPLLVVIDPVLMLPFVDGVVLVVDSTKTGRGDAKRSADALRQGKPGFVGTVYNRVERKGGGGYRYYYHDYYGDREKEQRRPSSRKLEAILKVFKRRRPQSADRT